MEKLKVMVDGFEEAMLTSQHCTEFIIGGTTSIYLFLSLILILLRAYVCIYALSMYVCVYIVYPVYYIITITCVLKHASYHHHHQHHRHHHHHDQHHHHHHHQHHHYHHHHHYSIEGALVKYTNNRRPASRYVFLFDGFILFTKVSHLSLS